jgi:hypothetical protein
MSQIKSVGAHFTSKRRSGSFLEGFSKAGKLCMFLNLSAMTRTDRAGDTDAYSARRACGLRLNKKTSLLLVFAFNRFGDQVALLEFG